MYNVLLVLLVGCASEEGIKVYNTDPVATITSHVDGVEVLEGTEITFIGIVDDGNHNTTDLLVQWSTDTQELCPQSTPDADGTTSCRTTLTTADTQLKLQVVDPEGAAVLSSIVISVLETEAPSATILSPRIDESYYADQLISFSAVLDDLEDEAPTLSYTWESNLDGVLPLTTAPDSDGSIEAYLLLSEGQHAITLRVEDSSGKTSTESLAILVGAQNNEPSCEILEPISGNAFVEGQNINFSAMAIDADINNSLLSINWESNRDGVFDTNSANTDGSIGFAYDGLSAGIHTITLRVEDEVEALCQTSTQVTVGTIPTLVIDSPTNGAVYSVGESLLFSATVSDQEDVPSDLAILWESDVDGVVSTQGADSSGNISFATNALSGGLHNVFVSATDSSGLSASSTLLLRINHPPTQPSISISPNPADGQDDLTATISGSTDADGDAISYTYEWMQNGVLTSYTASTIPASATTSGDIWTLKVTPNDGYTDGTYAEESIEILNSAPTFSSSAAISPSSPVYTGTILSCSAAASDIDDGVVPVTYSWSVGSVVVGSSSSYTVSASDTDVGSIVTCTATATDSDGEISTSSASVIVENTDPVLSGPSLNLTVVYNDDVLVCSASVIDPDEPTLSVGYSWSIGSSLVGSGSSFDLSTTSAVPLDVVICTASASDDQGVAVSGDISISLLNRPPLAPGITLAPSAPLEGQDDLVCSVSSSSTDPDGDISTYSFGWDVDGQGFLASNSTSSSSTIDASETNGGELWTCTITPNDGLDDGSSASASVEIDADWDGQREFSSCGVSGRVGPSQGECTTSYTSGTLDGDVSVLDGIQYWIVPSTGTYTLEAWGAQGGAGTTNGSISGGEGAYLYGEFELIAGEELKILVGQKSDGLSRGTSNAGGGGGGGSFIAYTDNTPLLVAGGGGGTGANQGVVTSSTDGQGGASPGVSSSNGSIAVAGQGGYAGHDGAGGGGFSGNGADSAAGYGGISFISGGLGGGYSLSSSYPAGSHIGYGGFGGGGGVGHAGGGGGGYSGGNGTGTYGNGSWTGGGSSYNAGSNTSSQSGARSGDGLVIINKL